MPSLQSIKYTNVHNHLDQQKKNIQQKILNKTRTYIYIYNQKYYNPNAYMVRQPHKANLVFLKNGTHRQTVFD